MNETKSLKLHKSHKIVCFIVCFVIVFSITCISVFADTYNYQFISQPYVTNETMNQTYFTETIYPILDTIDVGQTLYFPTSMSQAPNLYLIRVDNDTFNIGITIVDPELGNEPIDIAIIGIDYEDINDPYIFNGFIDLDDTEFSFGVSIPNQYATVITAFFPSSYIIEYEGNPWVDILTGVTEALDVNIFGTFSYLDIVSTLAGACLAIWLLKMLAGG